MGPPWPIYPASTGQSTAVPRGPFPTPTLVQQFSAGRRIPGPPLEAPWTGLRRPGERAMEGPFSPSATGRRASCSRTLGASMPQALTGAALEFGTARSEQPRPWLARRAPPWGALSLVPFFGQAKKGTRPRAIQVVRSAPLEAGETACKPVRLLKYQVVQPPIKAPFNNR